MAQARAGQGIEQRALADFIARGHYTTHIRRMRALYQARRNQLLSGIEALFGDRKSVV